MSLIGAIKKTDGDIRICSDYKIGDRYEAPSISFQTFFFVQAFKIVVDS